MERGYSALELASLAGFETTIMLNYLERAGIFEPQFERMPHHGKKRQYSFRDLIVLRAINQLLKMGVRPKRIAESIQTFRHIENLPDDVDALLAFSQKSSSFVVNSNQVLYCENADSIVDLSKGGQLEMAFILDVPKTLGGVAQAAQEYKKKLDSHRPMNKKQVLGQISKKHRL